ncbi:MAG: lysyl oxidase family protein [Verrucomicrobiota bacterium]
MLLRVLLMMLVSATTAISHEIEVTPLPKVIQDGRPLVALRAPGPHSMDVFRLTVPPGTTTLDVSTAGGRGDVHLYLRRGAHPVSDGSVYDHASIHPGNREQIKVTDPEAGIWFVGLITHDDPYSGVRLLARTRRARGTLPLPRFNPNPGVFSGEASIRMMGGFGGKVHYTTDGSEPDENSPTAPRFLSLNEDTTIKARLVDRRGKLGPIAEATYFVKPTDEVVNITSALSASHLAGTRGDRHLFKINVAAGRRLIVQAEGGSGGSTLIVNHGSPPPMTRGFFFNRGATFFSGSRKVEIDDTEAGDYYIALDARGNFSERTLFATVITESADLMPWAPALRPYVSTETFDPSSCEVQEGLIGEGERRLLRYTTEVRNVGVRDLRVPAPEGNPNFEYHECHGHYHFRGFAYSAVLDLEGKVVREGNKVSFCLLDNNRWDRNANRFQRYDCDHQGIQAGWADVYDSGLPGQWVEIGDLAPGNYQLELTINPDGLLDEENRENNTVRIPITIP